MSAAQARLRPALLALLGDTDGELRGQALAFWHSALPQALDERLRILLTDSLDCPTRWVRPRLKDPFNSTCWSRSEAMHGQEPCLGTRVTSDFDGL